ncbi:MAG: ribonuclease HII [Candidatus Auribacterota bacterium]|jgi:ribonuclease HII|nr:ribonuclease HII [Candidatus Auribacterota bacterium]
MFRFEELYRKKGKFHIAGIDEAGRGPLAGPVVAAAVVLPVVIGIDGINDSKKLSEKVRSDLFEKLLRCPSVQIGVGIVSERIIDEINILQATKLAMKQAIENLPQQPDHLLIDGLSLDGVLITQTKIIKGDSCSISIASASIIAKVIRDAIMVEYEKELPGYNFAKHKGYGTQDHCDALLKKGVSCIHRKTFAPVVNLRDRNLL